MVNIYKKLNVSVFEKEFFKQLKKNDENKCINTIDNNSKLIESYLNSDNPTEVKKFVNAFNDVVLNRKVKTYELFETVLKHNLFTDVYKQFRESDVLIRACKDIERYYKNFDFKNPKESCNINVIKWLLTMNINYRVQGEKGMTALMYAVKTVELNFVVKELMKKENFNDLLDNEGNNVLFHAAHNLSTLKEFYQYKNAYNPNHLNKNNENIFLYCSRLGRIKSEEYLKLLIDLKCADTNIENSDGKTIAMYLSEYGRYKELNYFVSIYDCAWL
eukprot:jgi/Orpsp1_1/1180719/evm.model.c7180000074419.1